MQPKFYHLKIWFVCRVYYRPCKRHNSLTNQISTLNNRPIKMNSFIPKAKTYNSCLKWTCFVVGWELYFQPGGKLLSIIKMSNVNQLSTTLYIILFSYICQSAFLKICKPPPLMFTGKISKFFWIELNWIESLYFVLTKKYMPYF